MPDLVSEWSRKVRSIRVDSEGAKHLFSLCEKRHFAPVQNCLWLLQTVRLQFIQDKKAITYFPAFFYLTKVFWLTPKVTKAH